MNGETSLRVVVRARPMNARETREGATKCVEYYENTGQIVINGAATFAYDSVFPDTVDQELVYEKTALPLLDRVFAGFNATVLAYGQTGSGKTYTMGTEDNDNTDEMRRGIIPRLVDALFKRIHDTGVTEAFKVTVSMYEVYGDNVFDLLRPDKVKLNVHGDEKNCTIVNLTAVPVTDLKGALKQLATGCHYRTKAETAMNAMSSRSHAVFTLYVEKTAVPDSDQAFSAKLQLVDLAGSERLKKTEAEGNRMKEGININAGLLILSQVISALATKQKHVPYRNSVITRVLQDSLGGNSFTVFLACISPADTNSQETLNTLRYADRAKQIKNKPIVNKNPKAEEISVLHSQISRLKKEIAELRQGIVPTDHKAYDIAQTAEILSLKDELLKKDVEAREKNIKLSDTIVRMSVLTNKLTKFEADKQKMASMLSDVRNAVQNEEMMDSTDVVQSIQTIIGVDSDASVLPDEDDDTPFAMDETMYDTERLPELQAQLDDIDKEIAMKDENQKRQIDNQRELIAVMQQREDENTQMKLKVNEMEAEMAKLRAENRKVSTVSKISEERRQKLRELEKQTEESKKTMAEFRKLTETRRKMEEAMRKTDEELKNLKNQRLRLLKEQRAEASKFQAFKQKHEREMAQMKSKLQKREMDVMRQKRIDEQKLAVLQQRLSESNRANKALRELNQKRANRKGAPTDSNALQALIEDELEIEAAAQRCQYLCEDLRRQRTELQEQINKLESKKFDGGKRRKLSMDPDVSVVLEGEEEFEEARQSKLTELRASLEEINVEIKDLLKNSTISGDDATGTKSNRWEKVPAEMRPVFETIYKKAVSNMKKSVELEFLLEKTKNDCRSKLAIKAKNEEKKKRDDEDIRSKFRDLSNSLEEAKTGLHANIGFLLGCIKNNQIDEKFFQQFDSLRNQFCDVEQKINKARRRTTNFAGGLTPKPELKRNERSRKAVQIYGNVVSSEDMRLDESRRMHRVASHRSAFELDKVTEDNVKRRVAMSPIKLGDETHLSEENEEEDVLEEMDENDENTTFDNATFVKDSQGSVDNNATFVINAPSVSSSSSKNNEEAGGLPPIRRKSRRTDLPSLGPI